MTGAVEGAPRLMDAVKFDIVHHTRGAGIELARGRWRAFPHFVAVRERGDTTMPPDVAADLWVDSFAKLDAVRDGDLDFVFACDIEVDDDILREAAKKLRAGGHFVIAAGAPHAPQLRIYQADGAGLLEPRADPREARPHGPTACVVRYGGIGDAIMATGIIEQLARDGYHVKVLCDPLVHRVLRENPCVGEFLVQDKDQVPNELLPAYWAQLSKRFDRFVNLSGLVEETLIALPGRTLHRMPHAARHALCNRNYLEFQALVAELPYEPACRFHPTDAETVAAEDLRQDLARALNGKDWVVGKRWVKPFVVMWVLSGSGYHKAYPHMDAVIARALLETPDACFVLVGDEKCKILETGWEHEPRVKCLAGEQDIRDTLALAQQCDLVIGPETGVLNAVAFEAMPKIVFLSHSSVENLTRDWVNTDSLEAAVACHPCHQNHNSVSTCRINVESGAAACMHDIAAADVWEAFLRAHRARWAVHSILETA